VDEIEAANEEADKSIEKSSKVQEQQQKRMEAGARAAAAVDSALSGSGHNSQQQVEEPMTIMGAVSSLEGGDCWFFDFAISICGGTAL
jgi:hypothetical protein